MSLVKNSPFPRAGFRRRMASWLYDLLLAVAVYMTAGAASFLIISLLVHFTVFDLQGYEHLSDTITNTYWLLLPNELWKLGWVAFFFVWFWSKSGQTLGMKAWRLKVQNQDGSLMTKTTAMKRLLPTLLGLGNFAVLVDRKNKLSIQDRLTDTEVVLLTLEANRGRL
tara:strand:+ start:315 stop:815 length:501 start_codon:yes stop_codon:yes gene_type:complete